MEVQKAVCGILTNEEVAEFLKGPNASSSNTHPGWSLKGPSATLRLEVLTYLENKVSISPKASREALKPFRLTPAEELMILNHKPKSTVEILLLLEDCEDRFEESKIEELLKVIEEKC